MTPKSLFPSLFALALAFLPPPLPAAIFETSFEEFTPGEIHGQNNWSANFGTGIGLCTILANDTAPLPAADGSQMLQLIRPGVENVPATGVIFHREAKPLLNFSVGFQMAYEAKTSFPLFQFQIGSAADSESGVHVGIGFFEETKSARILNIYQGRGSDRRPVSAPGSRKAVPTEPLVFYHFTIRVHGDGHLYDLTVRQEGKVIAATQNQTIPQAGESYNRLIISIPGGSQNDQLFFDSLKIDE